MKTILHIIDTTGPGGAETVFIDLLTRLSKDKYRAIVVIRGKGWVFDELKRHGVTPIILDAKGSFNWRYLLSLRKIIKNEKVDLIQSHLLGSNLYSALAGLLTRTPVVATFHGSVDVGTRERFNKLKFAVINAGVNRVIAVSKDLSFDLIKRTSIKKSKLKIIYNGIAVDEFNEPHSNELRIKFGWNDDVIIIGSLGNIRTAKAYDKLLLSAALLKDSNLNFRFVIAGQGGNELHKKLLSLRKELKLIEYVHFLGFNDAPARFLSNLDLLLLSSISEGFSIATLQAMASKIPVLATRSGGPEEILSHGETGWLVKAGDAKAIATELERLFLDIGLMKNITRNAHNAVAEKFSISKTLMEYESVYNELI